MTPDIELAGAREATTRLLALVDRTPDLAVPSLLPGWSRAHVVAHLAGNARSHVHMLQGTLEGTINDQYPGGAEGRAADIEELASRPADAVVALHESAGQLDDLWRVADWSGLVRTLHGGPQPAHRLPWGRWREVEVHAIDLAAGYRPQDWPTPFLERLLPELLARTDLPPLDGVSGPSYALAAWLTGRSTGDELSGDLPVLPEWR